MEKMGARSPIAHEHLTPLRSHEKGKKGPGLPLHTLPSPCRDHRQQIFLGSDQFVEMVRRQARDEHPLDEILARQKRQPARPLSFYTERYSKRNRAMAEAYRSGGYSMREIAINFEVGRMTVSRTAKLYGPTSQSDQQKDVQWETWPRFFRVYRHPVFPRADINTGTVGMNYRQTLFFALAGHRSYPHADSKARGQTRRRRIHSLMRGHG